MSARSLTSAERQVAFRVRLGLTTKEISALTGRSVRAVEKSRNRINNKIGIVARDEALEAGKAARRRIEHGRD